MIANRMREEILEFFEEEKIRWQRKLRDVSEGLRGEEGQVVFGFLRRRKKYCNRNRKVFPTGQGEK